MVLLSPPPSLAVYDLPPGVIPGVASGAQLSPKGGRCWWWQQANKMCPQLGISSRPQMVFWSSTSRSPKPTILCLIRIMHSMNSRWFSTHTACGTSCLQGSSEGRCTPRLLCPACRSSPRWLPGLQGLAPSLGRSLGPQTHWPLCPLSPAAGLRTVTGEEPQASANGYSPPPSPPSELAEEALQEVC